MTPELTALALCGIWQVVMIGAAGAAMNRDVGLDYNASPRDAEPEFSRLTGRLRRAVDNHVENLGLFTIAVVCVQLSAANSPATAWAAWAFLAARILYLPAYAYGWAPWRSLIWLAGLAATLTLIFAALF